MNERHHPILEGFSLIFEGFYNIFEGFSLLFEGFYPFVKDFSTVLKDFPYYLKDFIIFLKVFQHFWRILPIFVRIFQHFWRFFNTFEGFSLLFEGFYPFLEEFFNILEGFSLNLKIFSWWEVTCGRHRRFWRSRRRWRCKGWGIRSKSSSSWPSSFPLSNTNRSSHRTRTSLPNQQQIFIKSKLIDDKSALLNQFIAAHHDRSWSFHFRTFMKI